MESRMPSVKNSVYESENCPRYTGKSPIPVAARNKAWVCGSSLAGIACSNTAGGRDFSLL